MASLNLINWRSKRRYLFIWQYRFQYLMLVFALAAAGMVCGYYYRPLLQHMHRQIQSNQGSLASFSEWQQRYQAHQEQQQQRHRTERANQTQGYVLQNFYQLTTMKPEGVVIERIHCLPGELSIQGRYDTVDALRGFVAQLQSRFPKLRFSSDFPRQQQFVLNGQWTIHNDA